jgi:hypothetical protein
MTPLRWAELNQAATGTDWSIKRSQFNGPVPHPCHGGPERASVNAWPDDQMADEDNRYQAFAECCQRIAETRSSDAAKRLWLDVAETWRKLAREVEALRANVPK